MAFRMPSTAGLARVSARHPWRMLGLWLLIIVISAGLAGTMGGSLNDAGDFTNDPDSKHGSDLIEARIGAEPASETIVIDSAIATVDDPAFRAVVEQVTASLRGLPDAVANVANTYELAAAGDPSAASLVSEDRLTTILPVTLVGQYEDVTDYQAEYMDVIHSQGGDGIRVYSVGDASGNEVYGKIAEEDQKMAESVGLPVALLTLVVVFGALVAAGIPIVLGIVSIAVAMGLTAIVAQVLSMSSTVMMMITMIGLAVGIDYALFVIERYREERRHGMPKHEAIELAGATAGKAVFFSGMTVMLALLGMFLIPITIFHSLAAGAILAVVVAVSATQTFVPAVLSLLGDRIDWPRRRRYDDPANLAKQARYDHETIHRGFWGSVTKVVMRHPVVTLLIAVGILVGAALPVIDMRTGTASLESLPETDVKAGYELLADKFYAGTISPVQFVVDGAADDPLVKTGVTNLTAALAADPLFGPATVTTAPNGDLVVIEAPMSIDSQSQAAYDEIRRLRDETVPATFGTFDNHVYVTGASAGTHDFNTVMDRYTPIVFAFVLGLSFLLLMVAFRSVVVPLKAIAMNLLSVGAAYGVLVAVFQEGWGAELLGFQQTETIAAWLPAFLFCILFGLSMDYHVFLLSRIREHYDGTGRNDESVAVGLQSTAKIITGAALIMVVVFGAFSQGRLSEMQQMGFGMAVAVFLDATLVRSILVPSGMKLLGDRNWYLPRWLGWLPDVRIEGAQVPAQHQPAPAVVASAGGGD